jgi:hypothetical protein
MTHCTQKSVDNPIVFARENRIHARDGDTFSHPSVAQEKDNDARVPDAP